MNTVLGQQGGQAGHRLRGEVPHRVQHVSGVDPIVVCGDKIKMHMATKVGEEQNQLETAPTSRSETHRAGRA